MRKYNPKIETRAVKTILNGSPKKRARLLSTLTEEHFGYEPTGEVFARIMSLMGEAKDVPKARTLVHDPMLSEKAQNIVNTPLKIFQEEELDSAISTLEKYRKARVQTQGLERALRCIENLDVDKSESILEKTLFRSHSVSAGSIIQNEQIAQIARGVLEEKHPRKYPTGFSAFDNRSGGFPHTGVVILSAPPGCLKTAMTMHIATMQYLQFELEPCFVSLEMPKEEVVERQMAMLAGVSFDRIQLRSLTRKDKRKIIKAYDMFEAYQQTTKKKFTIYSPDDDVTFLQLMNQLIPFKHDLIYIDYINLLANKSEAPDWQHLRETTRLAKRLAKKLGATIVLLAQLDDEGNLRYSKGIRENCLVGTTLLSTDRGLIRLDSPNNVKVTKRCKHNIDMQINSGAEKTKAIKWYSRGKKPVYSLESSRGYIIKGTAKERVLVLTPSLDYVWKYQKDIKQGDYVAISRKGSCWSRSVPTFDWEGLITSREDFHNYRDRETKLPKKMTIELAALLGYMCAEGSMYEKGWVVDFSNADKEVLQDFKYLFYKCFGYDPVKDQIGKNGVRSIRTNNRTLYEYLSYLGLGNNSRNKKVPWCVLQAPKKYITAFLRAYFEGDGGLTRNGITVTSYSLDLLKEIQVLLLQYGIISGRHTHKDSYKRKRTNSSYYDVLNISGPDAAKFHHQIGFLSKRKRLAKTHVAGDFMDGIPFIADYIRSLKISKNQVRAENGDVIQTQVTFWGSTTQTVPYYKIKDNLQAYKKHFPSLYTKLSRILKDNYYWDEVISNKKSGYENVYDVTTQSGQYVANGIVVHNCDNWWKWLLTETDKQAGFMTIEQGKARNMPTYPFKVGINPNRMTFFDYEGDDVYSEGKSTTKKIENKARKKYKELEAEVDMENVEF